jgi:hypothetical protein
MAAPQVPEIAQIIQLAIAPVFLLVGIGGLLNVMSGRLARIVDRVRMLELDVLVADEQRRRDEIGELAVLAKRMTICHWAIGLSTLSAMLVCVMVIVLFLSSVGAMKFAAPVAWLFIAVMLALTAGLVLFLAEINISLRVVRVRKEYLRAARELS